MDWLSDNAWAAWLAVASVLAVAEMFSLDLILIMLAVGAIAGMVTSLAGAPFILAALVAGGASVAMLGLVRPSMVTRLHSGPDLQMAHSKLVGSQGKVVAAISGHEVGQIRVAGELWTAAPYDDTLVIAPGETVEVLQIRGATAYVHPVPSLEA